MHNTINTPDEIKPTEAQILAGGEEIELVYNGRQATAFVRQVKPSELTEYLRREAEGDDSVLSMVVTVNGEGIALDAVDLDSYEALIEADKRQNFTHARRKEERETARAVRQMELLRNADPESYRKMQAAQGKAMESLLSSLVPSPPVPEAGGKSPQ